jgi:hypothetical protein
MPLNDFFELALALARTVGSCHHQHVIHKRITAELILVGDGNSVAGDALYLLNQGV